MGSQSSSAIKRPTFRLWKVKNHIDKIPYLFWRATTEHRIARAAIGGIQRAKD
jgi:hypothetical protein